MKKRVFVLLIAVLLTMTFVFSGCQDDNLPDDDKPIGWDGKSVTYSAKDISEFGSGTPIGGAEYFKNSDTTEIYPKSQSLDNYGGVQTPSLSLDFSKAVVFKMEVVNCNTQYIVKLAVAGESEYYYVLSDEGKTGVISVNVVDAMLCAKYKTKNTQPNPGYETGWKYKDKKVNCNFYIMAKGPDGEKETATLELKSISIYNNQTAVTSVNIVDESISNNKLEALKGDAPKTVKAEISPNAVTDKTILWSSMNENVATVDNGKISFVGVGKTYITATSYVDQSKTGSIEVNVKSGFEDANKLKAKLESGVSDIGLFNDLFNTTWGADITQALSVEKLSALESRVGKNIVVENYFDKSNLALVAEANANNARANLNFNGGGNGNAKIYRLIDGKLSTEVATSSVKFSYAKKVDSQWQKLPSYTENTIVVWSNGEVKKYTLNVQSLTMVKSYTAAEIESEWAVPNRDKQAEDNVVHSLSPAKLSVSDGLVTIKQNKYPEVKYCFGGVVSEILTIDKNKKAQIVLDVAELNKKNEFVKTMWDVRIIFYNDNGAAANATPVKLDAGSNIGAQTITFQSKEYSKIRIYLVVNGSDIGEQYADAMMKIRSIKLHICD